jgi:hypothetical protein
VTALSASRSYLVSLSHANRPPTWADSLPLMVTPALTSGLVGPPLLQFVDDADLALNIGENETFAIIAGNVGNTFAVSPLTGQIYVANNSTSAFQLGSPPFNLTISVTDGGINGPRYTAIANLSIQVRRLFYELFDSTAFTRHLPCCRSPVIQSVPLYRSTIALSSRTLRSDLFLGLLCVPLPVHHSTLTRSSLTHLMLRVFLSIFQ